MGLSDATKGSQEAAQGASAEESTKTIEDLLGAVKDALPADAESQLGQAQEPAKNQTEMLHELQKQMENYLEVLKMTQKMEHDYEKSRSDRMLRNAPNFINRIPHIRQNLPKALHEYEVIRHDAREDVFKVEKTAEKDWQTGNPLHLVIVICSFITLWLITCRVCPKLGHMGYKHRLKQQRTLELGSSNLIQNPGVDEPFFQQM